MSIHQKQALLANINVIPEENLKFMYLRGDFTRQELLSNGIKQTLVDAWDLEKKKDEDEDEKNRKKAILLNRISNRECSYDELREAYLNKKFVLEDLRMLNINPRIQKAIGNRLTQIRSTIVTEIRDLPAMQQNRTDLIFIGLSGTGKSTMMSGVLNAAVKRGIILPETHNHDGVIYMNQVLAEMDKSLLPEGTRR